MPRPLYPPPPHHQTALERQEVARVSEVRPPTGKAMLTEDKMASGAIHRSDVAKLVVDALYSKKLTKKIVTAIDPSLAEAPPAYAAAEV